jgi:hypothetical protein
MEGPLYRLLILCRSVNKQGRHRQFLFLIGRFLKIFSSFGKAVSGEKIFLEINQSEKTMACGGHVC